MHKNMYHIHEQVQIIETNFSPKHIFIYHIYKLKQISKLFSDLNNKTYITYMLKKLDLKIQSN